MSTQPASSAPLDCDCQPVSVSGQDSIRPADAGVSVSFTNSGKAIISPDAVSVMGTRAQAPTAPEPVSTTIFFSPSSMARLRSADTSCPLDRGRAGRFGR